MRKQYKCIVGLVFAGIFFCNNRNNNLKACGTNTIACTPIKKKVKTVKPVKKIVLDNGSKEKGSVYMFLADPFINSN